MVRGHSRLAQASIALHFLQNKLALHAPARLKYRHQLGATTVKASELVTSTTDYAKVLVFGDSGTGKTCFAASFPGPIEYWDFDSKVASAVQHYAHEPARLEQIEVHQFSSLAPNVRMGAWEKRSAEIDALMYKKQPLPFKTLVLDSMTLFSYYMLQDYVYRSQTSLKRPLPGINCLQDYQLLRSHVLKMVNGMVLGLPAHVVITAHIDVEKDETTGQMMRLPLMSGKLAAELPAIFPEVYVARINAKGERVLQTQGDATYTYCRTQRKLAKEIPTHFNSLGINA